MSDMAMVAPAKWIAFSEHTERARGVRDIYLGLKNGETKSGRRGQWSVAQETKFL